MGKSKPYFESVEELKNEDKHVYPTPKWKYNQKDAALLTLNGPCNDKLKDVDEGIRDNANILWSAGDFELKTLTISKLGPTCTCI